MSTIRKLASQTAIYGLSSIIGRFLNYLLVPLHTNKSVFSLEQYGIITEMYAYVSVLVILLTYGMETAFFRFYSREELNKNKVYSTALWSVMTSTAAFIFLCYIFAQPLADWLRYHTHKEYIIWFAVIVGLDAVSSIALAKLRALNKAVNFAFVNLSNVAINIGLNLFFLAYCMPMYKAGNTNWLIETFYNPNIGVGYVFIANLIASIFKFALLIPYYIDLRFGINKNYLKQMLIYGLPLLFAGLAGIINETLDRIMLKQMLVDDLGEVRTMELVGIYGAVYKISIIITLFIQAFRFAADPFFFAQEKEKNSKETYSKVMTYFVIVCAVIFLGVMLYLDIIKYFITNEAYWVGLHIVPYLLFANIFLGIYYNQSIWYKLSGQTMYALYLALFGAALTIVLNIIWIPSINYTGSAYATFICYGSMMLLSYFLGQKYYPIPYNRKKILFYLGSAFGIYYAVTFLPEMELSVSLSIKSAIFLSYIFMIYILERKGLKNA
jgi:O-antigen/teichoic acid export membrane protein